MVNSVGGSSNSFNSSNIVVGEDCGGGGDDVVDRPAVTRFTHRNNEHERSDSPSSADTTPTLLCESGFAAARTTADGGVAVLRRYSIDKQKDAMTATTATTTNTTDSEKTSGVYCSLPLEKVQGLIGVYTSQRKSLTKRLLCLYCDRTFVTTNLRQKHVDRCHSLKQVRRQSSRRYQNQPNQSPCAYCDRSDGCDLKLLFVHLATAHSKKYFACVPCEERFSTLVQLNEHNVEVHPPPEEKLTRSKQKQASTTMASTSTSKMMSTNMTDNNTAAPLTDSVSSLKNGSGVKKTVSAGRELKNKKLAVKSTKMGVKRSARLQSKSGEGVQKVPRKTKSVVKTEENVVKTSTSINPYPQFDSFFQVKKITDHSIDNLRISTLTFEDVVFDKAFYNRIKCNIQENLLNYIDGKLFKNEESESRISNFEKVATHHQEFPSNPAMIENYGCDISLNAATPVAMLLSTQFGEDLESQIEYGSKASKKKIQTRTEELPYKYFTRRKYQASILEHKENRDLSKLDMWTQLVIKNRQQKIAHDKKTPKELLDYTKGQEYKNKLQQEELNRILDKRGPFEDLKEEASKKAAFDKLSSGNDDPISQENFSVVTDILTEIVQRVCEKLAKEEEIVTIPEGTKVPLEKNENLEIPSYLKLKRCSLTQTEEIDKSDRITLICSSQETENFDVPNATVRQKDEMVELTGEWARTRIYICAACGLKLPNMKLLMEHKGIYHQNVWCQHYEFVGNQSELYRHLSIPGLGKVGQVECEVKCKLWHRSDARLCSKCSKQCHTLGELHRHVLECGGDWSWMLARKKCKYRPFGAKTRRKRRGLVKRIINPQQKSNEKKRYKKRFEGPRQKPSDAETIQRMLANLPPKRATRKIMCLKDGFPNAARARKQVQVKNKVKCGKVICKQTTDTKVKETKEEKENVRRKSLRRISKVLSSRILDTSKSLMVKRKIKSAISSISQKDNIPEASKTKRSPKRQEKHATEILPATDVNTEKPKTDLKSKKTQPLVKNGKINIKNFFPVAKNPNIMNHKSENNGVVKKSKLDVVGNFMRTLTLRKAKIQKQNEEALKPKLALKRKLQSSLQTTVKKIKSVRQKKQNDGVKEFFRDQEAVPENKEDFDDKMPLLEKIPDTPEKFDLPADLPVLTPVVLSFENNEPQDLVKEAKSTNCDSNCRFSQTEDSKNDLEENEISSCKIINDPPKIIPCTKQKNKLKKPNRGLNDCIAMLTNKLQQKAVANEPFCKPIFSFPNVFVPSIVTKEDFDSTLDGSCYEVLDLSKKVEEKIVESNEIEQSPTDLLENTEYRLMEIDQKPRISEQQSLLMSKVEVIENAVKNHLARKPQIKRNTSKRRMKQAETSKKLLVSPLEPLVENAKIFRDDISELYTATALVDVNLAGVKRNNSDSLQNCNEEISIKNEATTLLASEIQSNKKFIQDHKVDIEKEEESSATVLKNCNKAELVEVLGEQRVGHKVETMIHGVYENSNSKLEEMKTGEVTIETIQNEEEEVTLENKSILHTNVTIVNPSDSEDEVPLSALRVNKNKTKVDECIVEEHATVTESEEQHKMLIDAKPSIDFAETSKIDDLNFTKKDQITNTEASNLELEMPVEILRDSNKEIISALEQTEKSIENTEVPQEIEPEVFTKELRSRKRSTTVDKKLEIGSSKVLRGRSGLISDNESEKSTQNQSVRRTTMRQQKEKPKGDISTDKENDSMNQSENQKEETLQDFTNLTEENKKIGKRKLPERKNGIIKHDNPFEYLNTWNNDAQSSEWLFKSALKAQEQNNMLVPTLSTSDEPIKQQMKSKTKSNAKRKKKSISNDSNIENKEFFCDICSKSFMRNDSLSKHYKTLIHIAKLSEIEARQAAEKLIEKSPERTEINLCNMLQESEKYVDGAKITNDVPFISPNFALSSSNSNTLKLADIINDVLNKPVEETSNKSGNFSNIILHSTESRIKRCKSLGERKSFESDNAKSSNVMDLTDNFGNSTLDNNIFAKTTSCADSLLEKQITLLENMIENRKTLNYIDDISVSSENNSTHNTPSEISSIDDSKEYFNNVPKTTNADLEKGSNNFIKPVQYEEISEDSGNYANNFEDQKARKTLNRDEELFLECCSLLKSGSEVSSYSKGSSRIKNFHLKPAYEPDWPEHKSFSVQCQLNETSHFMSDTSRIPTPLGDVEDGCSSNTVSFDLKNKTETDAADKKGDIVMFEDISEDKSLQEMPMIAEKSSFSFSFQFTETDEPSKGQEADIEDVGDKEEAIVEKSNKISTKLAGMVDNIKNKFRSLKGKGKQKKKRSIVNSNSNADSESSDEDLTEPASDNMKIVTKGALKVFEGLKVSIPTEDIDLTQVLNKKTTVEEVKVELKNTNEKKKPLRPKPQKNGIKQIARSFKQKPSKTKVESSKGNNKSYDVYDFEETQDNSDVFLTNPLPNYRNFRNQIESQDKPVTAKETETSSFTDTFSYEGVSVSSNSTISNMSAKKQNVDKNITKKKCMIMGRIFKNALKSKADDYIREIPELNNEKLVNDYVLSCPLPEPPKVTMTQEEMDKLFNDLLEGKTTNGQEQDNNNTETKNCKIDPVKTPPNNKQKPQTQKTVRTRKRQRNNSETTDDEFSIGKQTKKRIYKKNDKKADNSINLEQELKECIGVASRKSQRKCTSGKQNVLVEFWSSDESMNEANLEIKSISEEKVRIVETNIKKDMQECPIVPLIEKISNDTQQKQQVSSDFSINKTKRRKTPVKSKPKSKVKDVEKAKASEAVVETLAANRRKRASVNTLYYWSSSSDDEFQDFVEVKSVRDGFHDDDDDDDDDRPMQHGWIVGDSPKKLVTMLAQAKGKKTDLDSVKEQAKSRTSVMCS